MQKDVKEFKVVHMRFYIAGGSSNGELIKELCIFLERRSHECIYDWVNRLNYPEDIEQLTQIALNEVSIVRDAELFIGILPDGYALHTELGVALATRSNKRIILWSETGEEFDPKGSACSFYYHPVVERVVGDFYMLTDYLIKF